MSPGRRFRWTGDTRRDGLDLSAGRLAHGDGVGDGSEAVRGVHAAVAHRHRAVGGAAERRHPDAVAAGAADRHGLRGVHRARGARRRAGGHLRAARERVADPPAVPGADPHRRGRSPDPGELKVRSSGSPRVGQSVGMAKEMLGIDIGGTGIKGAPVDLSDGSLLRKRFRVDTPQPSEPEAVAKVVAKVVEHFGWDGPVGCTYPGVVIDGVTMTAANVSKRWIGLDAASLLAEATGREITLLNDADAAGIAEMRLGRGRGHRGTVLMLTLGTGIGSALFTDGVLVPNTEFGHIEVDGTDAELRASAKAREVEELGWDEWAERLSVYMSRLEGLLSPSLIIVGGGVSKRSEDFLPLIKGVRAEIVTARLVNNAGIV